MTARAGTFRIKLSRQVNSSLKIVLSQQEAGDSLVVQQRLTLLTEIFSVVDGVLLRPLPYPHAEQIVQLREVSPRGARMAFAEPNFLDLRARTHTLAGVGQYSGSLTTVNGGSEPVRALSYAVSADFFNIVGVTPIVGRTFSPEESRGGGAPVAIVSYGSRCERKAHGDLRLCT